MHARDITLETVVDAIFEFKDVVGSDEAYDAVTRWFGHYDMVECMKDLWSLYEMDAYDDDEMDDAIGNSLRSPAARRRVYSRVCQQRRLARR